MLVKEIIWFGLKRRTCVGYIFARGAMSPQCDEVTMDSVLLNMKNDVFVLISNIILQKVLTLLYPVQPVAPFTNMV